MSTYYVPGTVQKCLVRISIINTPPQLYDVSILIRLLFQMRKMGHKIKDLAENCTAKKW